MFKTGDKVIIKKEYRNYPIPATAVVEKVCGINTTALLCPDPVFEVVIGTDMNPNKNMVYVVWLKTCCKNYIECTFQLEHYKIMLASKAAIILYL